MDKTLYSFVILYIFRHYLILKIKLKIKKNLTRIFLLFQPCVLRLQ